MKIWIITMEDPLYTSDFIKDIIKVRSKDIAGLSIAKGGRLKIGKKRSKIIYLFSLFLIMDPYYFLKNSFKTLNYKIRKKLVRMNVGLKPNDLEAFAKDYNIHVDFTSNPNDEAYLEKLRAVEPDVIINQSQFIVKKPLLDIPGIGILNRHNALLPKNRGRLTPFWVVYKQEKETGVSIHFVDEGIDAGPVVVQKRFPVTEKDSFNTIVKKNYEIASKAMLEALDLLEQGHTDFKENDDREATYNSVPTFNDALKFRLQRLGF